MTDLIATAAFGLEAVVDRELDRLGYADRFVEDGRVTFAADRGAIARANLWLRSADRLLVELGRFPASDFGELFDHLVALPWEEWIEPHAAIGVKVRAVRSPITSVRHAQSISKKAIVTRLGEVHSLKRLPESGPACPVEVAINGTDVSAAINTSGLGLHKRGYRRSAVAAPLKETLAAGLLQLSFWRRERPLADPFCGTGTIPIEAALMAGNIAPGANRRFLAEDWPYLDRAIWGAAREEARQLADPSESALIWGSDHDPAAIGAACRSAREAGVSQRIHFQQSRFQDFRSAKHYGVLVTNPPYGERLGSRAAAQSLYRSFPDIFSQLPSWSFFVLTSEPEFAQLIDRPVNRRRKLYNGRIACTYYQIHGPRPHSPPGGA